MYISFDNGAHWQTFQLNLPNTPVTDIKVAHKDLVLSTQGRSFWILDNLTPLHQVDDKRRRRRRATSSRRARPSARPSRGGGGRGATHSVSAARRRDRLLPRRRARRATSRMEILDAAGKVDPQIHQRGRRPLRKRRRGGGSRAQRGWRRRRRPLPQRPHAPRQDPRHAPLHLGPALSRRRGRAPRVPKGPTVRRPCPANTPCASPSGSWTATQPLTVIEDPRITARRRHHRRSARAVRSQHAVRDLVSDVNQTVSRVRAGLSRAGRQAGSAATLARLNDLAAT